MNEENKELTRWYNRLWRGNKRLNFKAREEWYSYSLTKKVVKG